MQRCVEVFLAELTVFHEVPVDVQVGGLVEAPESLVRGPLHANLSQVFVLGHEEPNRVLLNRVGSNLPDGC